MSCTQNVKSFYELVQFMDQNFIDVQVLFTYGYQVKNYLSLIVWNSKAGVKSEEVIV